MISSEIVRTQIRVGTKGDGVWGPKSIAASQRHLAALMPKPNPWPLDSSTPLTRFFGAAGDEDQLTTIVPPYKMRLYDGSDLVKKITVNKRCAESLLRVLEDLTRIYPTDEERIAAGVTKYFGCFVNRNKRGGSTKSLHAYGAAIDFNANKNANHTHWPVRATMPIEVMECFAREGWKAAGAFWSRDAMHFQATR